MFANLFQDWMLSSAEHQHEADCLFANLMINPFRHCPEHLAWFFAWPTTPPISRTSFQNRYAVTQSGQNTLQLLHFRLMGSEGGEEQGMG